MKTIMFQTVKGGVGKSSSAIALAKILSDRNKVLLIDLDPQNATTSHFFSGDSIETIQDKTIRQLLLGTAPITNCIFQLTGNLMFIPSEYELHRLEKELSSVSNQYFRLSQALNRIKDHFDYCVIDSGPNINLMSQQAVIASDIIIMPTQLEKWAIRVLPLNFDQVVDCEKSKNLIGKHTERIYILPTMFEEVLKMKRQYLEAVYDKEFLESGLISVISPESEEYEIARNIIEKTKITKTFIHKSADVARTYSTNSAFIPEGSRAHQEYLALVEEICADLGVVAKEEAVNA